MRRSRFKGPKALPTLAEADAHAAARRFSTTGSWMAKWMGCWARIARTGYTGEDGFEIYVAPERAEPIWDKLLDAGQEFGIKPCGLGARNTLRLEAKMALYGHEIGAKHHTARSRSGLDREVRQA